MKLIKTIQNLVEEAEKEYNKVLESTTNMKEIERAEKNYFDSLKVLEKFMQFEQKRKFVRVVEVIRCD